MSVSTTIQNLAPSPPVPDLHEDRINEHCGINLISRASRPFIHFLDYLVGNPQNCFRGHRRAVDLSEMGTDLTSGQPLA